MKGTRVKRILIHIHRDVLVQTRKSLVALLSVRSDSKRMIIGPVRLVVDKSCLVSSCYITGLTVVVTPTIEELTLSIGKRFSDLLASEVHIRIEVDMSEAHSSSETESQRDGPNIIVTWDIVEKTLQASSDGPLKEHRIRCSGE